VARPNERVGAVLQEYADLLAITGEDAYKARSYEKAARSVAGYARDVSTLDHKGLRAIPGVGDSIASKIAQYVTDGRIAEVDELRAKIPTGVRELLTIPTLGPKKALALYQDLGIDSVAGLTEAIKAGELEGYRGFGAKTADNILHGIDLLSRATGRFPIDVATDVAEDLVQRLSAVGGCVSCTYAGSLRRMRETIGDIDILTSAAESTALMTAFAQSPLTAEVIARGPTKASIRTGAGLQIDLRVVAPEAWGAALQYFTGSKPHNVALRKIAARQGLKLSEYGLFDADTGELIVSATEDEVYHRLGLPWIPPPLREDRGEIDAALDGQLPDPVTVDDIRGDLHTHTDLTDGVSSMADMIESARRHGYHYYAITDHAKDLPMQRMTDDKMVRQREQIRQLEAEHPGMTLLHGTELNIGPDGEVDWDSDFLSGFDLCVASVHSYFTQPPDVMTKRLIRACENPYVTIIGHPTTRLIGRRDPITADFDAVFAAAARTGTALEINSFPDRLDLGDELILRARSHGVRFAIDTDAHSTVHLDYMRFGVGTAQRGWLTADDVINAWPLPKLRAFIEAKRQSASAR
jgi:DNA polymerase (family X)